MSSSMPKPRRPPPPPPSTAPPGGGSSSVSVDGVPDAVVDAWFRQADADSDGRVADIEARDFFLSSGLSATDLSKIWKLVKSPEVVAREGKGLTRRRFGQVLRLIALAQSGVPFSEENATAALYPHTWHALHGAPLPPPVIQAASNAAPPAPTGNPFAAAPPSGVLLGDLGLPPADAGDDLFGLSALQQQAAPSAAAAVDGSEPAMPGPALAPRRLSRSKNTMRTSSSCKEHRELQHNSLEPPLAFEARLPPLQPKASSKLSMLAAGNGSLFAGPAIGGGILQWARTEGNLRRPADLDDANRRSGKLSRLMSDMMHTAVNEKGVETEDFDSAPCHQAPVTDRKACTCLYVDEAANVLWVADKEGFVSVYDLNGEPGSSLGHDHLAHHFQAFRVGHVTALCTAPTGELWTGSSRGNIRVWELPQPSMHGEAPEPPRCRELRKAGGERPHGGPVLFLASPADGQLVWSFSTKGVMLWDAASGMFLGVLQRVVVAKGGREVVADQAQAGADAMLKCRIDSSKGLDVDPISRVVLTRPASDERARLRVDQEAWAAQTDHDISQLVERMSIGGSKVVAGVGKGVKLLGKLGKNLLQRGGGEGSADPGSARGPPAGGASQGAMLTVVSSSMPPPVGDEDMGGVASTMGDNRTGGILAIVVSPDSRVWVGHKGGRIDCYTSAGQLVWSKECAGSILSMCSVAQHIWVGFADGMLSILDSDGNSLKVFPAHAAGVISIAQAGVRTYTLGADGSIRGWSSATPHPADIDALVRWDEQAIETYRRESVKLVAVTWNVGESKPASSSAFFRWLKETTFGCQVAMVALQEIEMGSSSVALAAAKDAFSQRLQERGNNNAKFWSTSVLAALGGDRHWLQVGLRQLSGMLILVFARSSLREYIGEVATASVACGVLGVGGNKGAVAVEFTLHRRKVAVVCSHFAAHQSNVEARNSNYAAISRQLTFVKRAWFADEEDAASTTSGGGGSSAGGSGTRRGGAMSHLVDDVNDNDSDASSTGAGMDGALTSESLVQGDGMRNAELLVWMGDFNYRIDGCYEDVKERAVRGDLAPLAQLDQCKREMAAGRVFRGLREGPLTFRPTYKFDKNSLNPFGYDSSEKRRIPSWCDRVFFRGTVPFASPEAVEGEAGADTGSEDAVTVQALEYSSWSDVNDSDHKPVYSVLEVGLPVTDQAKKRAICSQLLKDCAAAAGAGSEAPVITLSSSAVKLHAVHMPTQPLVLSNRGSQPVRFFVCPAWQGRGEPAAAVRQLVDVRPVRGTLAPGQEQQLLVHLDQDAAAYASKPAEARYRVVVGGEYTRGGDTEAAPPCELPFTALCLTDM